MPLSEKARIEVYLPDLPQPAYQDLLDAFDQEFTYTLGGCTIIRGIDGSYLSARGLRVRDRINLIYTDTPYSFEDHFDTLSRYGEQVRSAAFVALNEESVLVVVFKV